MVLTARNGIVALAATVLLASGAPADASCIGQRFSQISETHGYHYVDFPASATRTVSSIVGRFWSPGRYASTGEGTCDESHWLYPYLSRHFIDGTFGAMECVSGCPDGEMIVLLEDVSTDRNEAYFAVGRVDETPASTPEFDFARIGRDWLLRPLPAPVVDGTSSGDPFEAFLRFDDPASGFFGLPGNPATGTITAFHVYRLTGLFDTRELASGAWTFVERIPYLGGTTTASVELRCPWDRSFVYLAAALELDGGQVLTHYVSRTTVAECDPFTPGAGRTPESGTGALEVSKTANGDLELAWGYSCITTEQNYSVYEGILGDWTSHAPRDCDIFQERNTVFSPPPFDAYYLVVPHEAGYEGSYGFDSLGNERPQGASVCRPQIVNLCP